MTEATGSPQHRISIYESLALSAANKPCGLFFDFDGVLAYIQPEPDSVNTVDGVVSQLARLAPLVAKIAIISARPGQFLARQFGQFRSLSLYGMYGLEAVRDGNIVTNPDVENWLPTIRVVKQEAVQELPDGIYVEDKRLSVAFHYRQHPEYRAEAEEWAHTKALEYGLLEQHGRMVVELKPPLSIDKGTVLHDEISDLRCAWYFGDDISDAKGFQALRNQHKQDSGFLGVCVAVRNVETGQDLEEQADYILPSPSALPDLLASAVEIFSAAEKT